MVLFFLSDLCSRSQRSGYLSINSYSSPLLAPLPVYSLPSPPQGELRDLGAAITRDIFTDSPNVRWEDIAGLDQAKRLIKEAVVMPIKYPQFFTGEWGWWL